MSYLKRLTNAALGRLQAFRMYGGIGMSASSLHRESTDSLIKDSVMGSYPTGGSFFLWKMLYILPTCLMFWSMHGPGLCVHLQC